jgi:putative membrane protein
MAGSLVKVWPWKETISTRVNSKGEIIPFIQQNSLPVVDDMFAVAVVLMVIGALVVLIMERVAVSHK